MTKLSMLFAREADRVREEQRIITAATTIQVVL